MAIAANNTRTLITLPKGLKTALEEKAKQENRSLNNLVVTILRNYISNG